MNGHAVEHDARHLQAASPRSLDKNLVVPRMLPSHEPRMDHELFERYFSPTSQRIGKSNSNHGAIIEQCLYIKFIAASLRLSKAYEQIDLASAKLRQIKNRTTGRTRVDAYLRMLSPKIVQHGGKY